MHKYRNALFITASLLDVVVYGGMGELREIPVSPAWMAQRDSEKYGARKCEGCASPGRRGSICAPEDREDDVVAERGEGGGDIRVSHP